MTDSTQKQILIVEDEAAIAMLLEMLLLNAGYGICGKVMSGFDAIEAVKTSSPDLILMDIKIKGEMDGIDTAKIITSTKSLPVIFLSAYSDEKTRTKASTLDHYGFFKKPFKKDILLKAIEETFESF